MELYEVIFDPKKDKGIYALSVVNDPAMEGMFIALNKDEQPKPFEVKLAEVNKEQRILLGVALVPDKPIYRNQDGKEFYITFPSETIKAAAHSFLQNQHNNNSSIEHEVKLSGVSVVESWIVEDEANDKSNAFGLNAPKGSWVASMKVDNDELWNDYVKTGKIKGFSIDGLFSLNKLELNKEHMSENKTSILAELKQGFADLKTLFLSKPEETKVELAQANLADGSTVEFEGEEIAVGTALLIVGEEGSTPAPDGEYELESGMIAVVAEGLVSELKEKEAEQEDADDSQELEELKQAFESLKSEMTTELAKFKTELATKDARISELETEKVGLETQLSTTPATKPKKHTDKIELSNSNKSLKLAIKNNRK
tara:strand:- start:147 stop:1256 length:1110 start_codon:yes stop_codon:yes gene_type:complete